METTKLIRNLFGSMDSKYIQQNADKIIDLLEHAAIKLDELQRFIDDMMGDHYVDSLDFYTNRCRELEEKLRECGMSGD